MGWITVGWGAAVGLFVMRVRLRQVRELLLDEGTVIRVWRELLSVVRYGASHQEWWFMRESCQRGQCRNSQLAVV